MTFTPTGNSNGGVYPWVYYLLGGKNEQFAVYNGMEFTDQFPISENAAACTKPAGQGVYLFPVEYNTYGAGSLIALSYKPDENGIWNKYYKIFDHLGSVRVEMKFDYQTPSPPIIASQYDYEPFGKPLAVQGNTSRLSFIDKEKDKESILGDFGVRKYDDGLRIYFRKRNAK
ncbi:MAG: hypothetical protein HW421_1620 [Ignavibacteria bacterium]|nr:hypothetical protein [Ignavibacteria bacterium]